MTKPPVRTVWNTRSVGEVPRALLHLREWYDIQARAESRTAEVRVYEEIGGPFGVSPEQFAESIGALDVDEIDLYLNTPGGLAYDGVTIFNALRRHKAKVNVTVDGIAASAGSVIAMAGDHLTMARGSVLMIHDGWGGTVGNAADHRKTAEILDKTSDSLAGLYAAKAGGTVAEWRARMLEETWYTAEEAVAAGLADVAELPPDGEDGDGDGGESQEAVAARTFDLSVFAYAGRSEAPTPTLPAVTGGGMAGEQPDPTEQALRDLLTHELLGGAL